jgi:hypothetical protein
MEQPYSTLVFIRNLFRLPKISFSTKYDYNTTLLLTIILKCQFSFVRIGHKMKWYTFILQSVLQILTNQKLTIACK